MNETPSLLRRGLTWAPMLAPILAVAACTAIPTPEAPPPAPAPVVTPAPSPTPSPALSWEDRPLDKGAWSYDANSRTARFVQAGNANPLVTMACSGGAIRLSAGLGGGQPLDVSLRTSAGADRLHFEGGAAMLPARDARLDRIAFSRGRFALEASNGSVLTLPVQSEIGRVIEDCR